MMKKEKELLVAIASQKGGVGKSVFTVLLASVLHYRKDVRVAVVDCDSPQHSIALMRERDMENVMKNDDLKVNLYRLSPVCASKEAKKGLPHFTVPLIRLPSIRRCSRYRCRS